MFNRCGVSKRRCQTCHVRRATLRSVAMSVVAFETRRGVGCFVAGRGPDEGWTHLFASPRLNPVEAEYLHGLDEHSDHTPLEVVFEPEHNRVAKGEATFGDGEVVEHTEVTTSNQESGGPSMLGLTYEEDVRSTTPNETGHRWGRFKVGWRKAVDGEKGHGQIPLLVG